MRVRRIVDAAIGLNLIVILLGAVVRATGSGAGCGRSWPTCQGEVVPALRGATAVEFTHRAFSGIALVVVAVMVVAVFRATSKGARARTGAVLVGVSIVIEALIGMAIVLAEWVANDTSVARTVSVPIHLVSTYVLLAGLVATRFLLRDPEPDRWELPKGERGWLLGIGGAMLLVAATGAVTALADTLFPKDFALSTAVVAGEHFLTRLRIIHPIVAVLVGVGAAVFAWGRAGRDDPARVPARIVAGAVGVQVLLGVLNVVSGTPLAVSLVHLLVADVLWMSWVWLVLIVATEPARNTGPALRVASNP